MNASEKLLRELIALPSVNPAFLPVGDARAGEQRVADFLAANAGLAGLDVTFSPALPGRPNLIARLGPKRPRARVVLAPHMDTVGHATMSDALFRPVKRGDRLFGRGACDTKGSVAAMLTALSNVARSATRPRETEIIFTALVDEESGQGGSRARPELGRNAVHAMSRVVEWLETDYAALLKKKRHPLLGTATVNVGTIHGGTQPNIVPDLCEISIDRRTIPGETHLGVIRELRALLKARGLVAELVDDKSTAPCWPMETDATLPLVQTFMAGAKQRSALGVHYFSDASVFAHGGTPAVLFGPGDIAQAHTADEWISLRSLESATALLTKFLSELP